MNLAVSAAEANRNFSRLLRDVRDGGSFVITSHGKPVARMVPVEKHDALRGAAKQLLLERLRSQPATVPPIGRWTRDELYED